MRLAHLFEKESWVLGLAFVIIAVAAFYVRLPERAGAPTTGTEKILPTTGEQGYPVLAFCQDGATSVSKAILPPDSTFAVSYTLDRVKGGVHETVSVNAYPGEKQPVGTHYTSDNTSSDAFVSKSAMECILRKAR